MAEPARFEVEGSRELRATMRKAGANMRDFTAANRTASAIVARDASARAPRLTGALAGSVRAGASQSSGIVRAGGARLPYAGPIHWGWPARNISAQRFATEAAAATEPTWSEVYFAELERIINGVRGR